MPSNVQIASQQIIIIAIPYLHKLSQLLGKKLLTRKVVNYSESVVIIHQQAVLVILLHQKRVNVFKVLSTKVAYKRLNIVLFKFKKLISRQ